MTEFAHAHNVPINSPATFFGASSQKLPFQTTTTNHCAKETEQACARMEKWAHGTAFHTNELPVTVSASFCGVLQCQPLPTSQPK